MRKNLITLVILLLGISSFVFSQVLEQRWAISTISVEPGSTGNTVSLRLTWNDGASGQTHGITAWTFEVTSANLTITSVTLHSTISSSFSITSMAITNGRRVNIYSNGVSTMLRDAGDGPATYLVAVVTFNAPAAEGQYTMTLTNLSATKRTTASPYTPSAQSFSNSTDNITVNVTVSATTPPVATPPFGYPPGTTRKYGDLNWDGVVDIADVTAMADVVIRNYGAVIVNDLSFGGPDNRRKFYEQPEGENPIVYNSNQAPDVLDAIISDVYRATGDPNPGQSPYPEPLLTLMDLETLEEAVANGAWPSYAIPVIAGKPAFKVSGGNDKFVSLSKSTNVGSVKFEVFNSGKSNSRIRVKFENNSDVIRGLQIEFYAFGRYEVYRGVDVEDLKLAHGKSENGRVVVLAYLDGGKYMKKGESVVLTIEIRGVTVESFLNMEPRVVASVANLSEAVSFEVVEYRGGLEIPLDYMLYQNYPNPFNPEASIRYDVPEYSQVKIIVWNALGQKVRVLVDGVVDPGSRVIKWDGRDDSGRELSSGVYFYTMYARSLESTREFTMTRKATLIR